MGPWVGDLSGNQPGGGSVENEKIAKNSSTKVVEDVSEVFMVVEKPQRNKSLD